MNSNICVDILWHYRAQAWGGYVDDSGRTSCVSVGIDYAQDVGYEEGL